MTDGILWQSSYSHEIGVAIERVDISDLDAFGRADQRGKLPACQLRDVESDRCVA